MNSTDPQRNNGLARFMVETVATVVFTYVAIRIVMDPTIMRTAHQRILKAAEIRCQKQAETWAHLADSAKHAYDKSRSVTV